MTSQTPIRRAPLAERLSSANAGTLSPAATPKFVAAFATLPVDFVYQNREKDLAAIKQVLALKSIREIDSAWRLGWDVEQDCLAQAAWTIERMTELGRACKDREQGARIELRARRVMSSFVSLPCQLAWLCNYARPSYWSFNGPAWSDDSVSYLNGISLRFKGSPEQLHTLYGTLTMSLADLFDACRALVRECGQRDKENALAQLRRSCERAEELCPGGLGQAVTLVLSNVMEGGAAKCRELASEVLARPLAALWASGALDEVGGLASASEASARRADTELERRLRNRNRYFEKKEA